MVRWQVYEVRGQVFDILAQNTTLSVFIFPKGLLLCERRGVDVWWRVSARRRVASLAFLWLFTMLGMLLRLPMYRSLFLSFV